MRQKRISPALLIFALGVFPTYSQVTPVSPVQPQQKSLERRGPDPEAVPIVRVEPAKREKPKEAPADYVLGADDQISLWTPEAEELNEKVLRIEGNGSLTIPLIGTIKAAGQTPAQLSAEISKRLEKYYKSPQVVVSVTEYRSQPVSVIGAVNTPGVHQVQGRKTLIEMLSMAGGTRADAGPTAVITRRAENGPLPIEGATTDASGQFSTAEVDLKAVMSSERPQDNIAIKPNDIISVPKARLVYVVGEVERAGGFVLTEREGISAIQALSMAGGMKATAVPANARILRNDQNLTQDGKPIDLKAMLKGSKPDVRLRPDDVLFIPGSTSRRAGFRAAEAVLQTLTGVVIWRAGNR